MCIFLFVQAILATGPIKYLGEYLRAKKIIRAAGDLKQLLHDLWFRMYKRDRSSKGPDSSGFEHVFVGEVSPDYKSGEHIVKGFHNWIQIHRQEIILAGKLNYRGYIRPKNRGLNSLKHDLEEEQVFYPDHAHVFASAHRSCGRCSASNSSGMDSSSLSVSPLI
jgi:hypothetical protein